MVACPLCHATFDDTQVGGFGAILEHYMSEHLIPVTDNFGRRAYTFECPQHGLADQAWGGDRQDNERSARFKAATGGIQYHLMVSHMIMPGEE